MSIVVYVERFFYPIPHFLSVVKPFVGRAVPEVQLQYPWPGGGGFHRSRSAWQVHILLDQKTKINLLPPSLEDTQWIHGHFDSVFPKSKPLDRSAFPHVAKLVLLRRVVRTLIAYVGVEQLKDGMAAPLVVNVEVALPSGEAFQLRTAPGPGVEGRGAAGGAELRARTQLGAPVSLESVVAVRW